MDDTATAPRVGLSEAQRLGVEAYAEIMRAHGEQLKAAIKAAEESLRPLRESLDASRQNLRKILLAAAREQGGDPSDRATVGMGTDNEGEFDGSVWWTEPQAEE